MQPGFFDWRTNEYSEFNPVHFAWDDAGYNVFGTNARWLGLSSLQVNCVFLGAVANHSSMGRKP